MKNPNERLRFAREQMFATAREAAEALGVNRQTYAGHENGADGFPVSAAVKYARRYKITLDWLLAGKGKGPEKRSVSIRADWQNDLETSIEFAVSEGASAGDISAFTTEMLLATSSDTKPVKDTRAALRSALLAHGVNPKSLDTVISFAEDNRISQTDEKSPQVQPRDLSEPSSRHRVATPSR